MGGFKIKKNGKKERVLFRKERAENEEKNGFSEEGGFKIKKKIERLFLFFVSSMFKFSKVRSKYCQRMLKELDRVLTMAAMLSDDEDEDVDDVVLVRSIEEVRASFLTRL